MFREPSHIFGTHSCHRERKQDAVGRLALVVHEWGAE